VRRAVCPINVRKKTGQIIGRTDRRQTDTQRCSPLDAANLITEISGIDMIFYHINSAGLRWRISGIKALNTKKEKTTLKHNVSIPTT